jgi:glycosyltransferase involved in cell wall biosynthesis
MSNQPVAKRMLVFHSAYTYEYLIEFGMEIFVQARDAGNFFEEILTVSPVANLQYLTDDYRNYTKPEFFKLDSKNLILEGKTTRYRFLKKLPVLNFAIAQLSLFVTIFRTGHLSEVQIVRAEDPRLNGLYGFFFSRLLRKPLVVGVWGNPGRLRELNQAPNMPRLFPTMKSEERVEKFVLNRADAVLAQNQENLNYALEAGVDPSKTHFTQLGVGIDKSHFLPKKNRQDVRSEFETWGAIGTNVLICISRLEALKMVDHAILASRTLKAAGVDFKLILVGEGRETNNLKSLAKKEGLTDEIIFAGNRSQAWIAGALNFVDINVAPLCGRSLLEASLGGLPAVSYDVDWHSEIVIPNSTGFLVPNLDFSAMGEAILQLCRDQELREQMATSMHQKAMDLASPEKIAQRQRFIYQELFFGRVDTSRVN